MEKKGQLIYHIKLTSYVSWDRCLPSQNSSLRPTEGKQVDQADINLIRCWKPRVRFSKLSKRFQLHPTSSWLQPLEHCICFSSTWTIFSCYDTACKVHMMLFDLSTFLLNINDLSKVWIRSYSYPTSHHIILILS